ncbi:MAG: hypothetical protein CVU08_11850 [Bacteroidetes bacterium HGW-Bacteroidetes-3]|nr:MAG: hypothetical protein CVU08_11850 [Bacteroidetes bacterium HGW-Bacteroidetes-3]
MHKPYIIYAQIGFATNRQTFNNNIASAEKSPIFKPHESYKNSLCNNKKNQIITILGTFCYICIIKE